MLFKLCTFLVCLLAICKLAFPQNGLKVHNVSSSDFLIEADETNMSLEQGLIKKNLEDGEYFIYYDRTLTQLWMNGVILEHKLEGKWEFRNKKNEINNYKMFSYGKEVKMKLPENNFAQIYLPNKVYVFDAYYISSSDDTVTHKKVTLQATSQIYEVRHNLRFQGEWVFEYTKMDSTLLGYIYPWNDWVDTAYCSINETENLIFIYPPRRNQFVFTEIIGFPSVSPAKLKIGYQRRSQTSLPSHYELEEWSDNTFYHQTEITEKTDYPLQGERIECWVLKGKSTNENFGTSYFEYLFNEEYGFVRMEWLAYDKQKAVFELDKVIQKE